MPDAGMSYAIVLLGVGTALTLNLLEKMTQFSGTRRDGGDGPVARQTVACRPTLQAGALFPDPKKLYGLLIDISGRRCVLKSNLKSSMLPRMGTLLVVIVGKLVDILRPPIP